MILRKWSYEDRVYRPYEIPDGWKVSSYEFDMETLVNCAQCGREIRYGDSYTSNEVHDPMLGFGYAVCADCYQKEMNRRMKAEVDHA